MMKEHENMKRFRTFRPLARKRLWCLFACHMLLFSNFTFSQETMDTDKEKTKELDLSFQKINWDEFNGSAYRVSGDQIRNLPISNLGNALAGLVPGFYSRQKSGGPHHRRQQPAYVIHFPTSIDTLPLAPFPAGRCISPACRAAG